jgi:gliding motility-associated-like protein
VIDTIQVLKLDSIHATNSSCNNICTGTASVWASGGQPPLTYLWSNGTSTSSILNLCPGIYSVIITNPNCVADTLYDTVKISSTLQSTASVIANTPCFDSCKGEAKVVVVGGTQPYQYLWSNGATTASFNQFCADTFIVKVTDNVGCVTFDTIIITQPNPIITNGIITSSHCFNKDGKIEINVVGGIKPYKYLWNNGNTAAINPTISQGNYNVIVEDSNHCKIKNSFKINGLYPTVYVTNDTLVGGGDTVKLFASGTYKYLWNPATNLNCDTCHNPLWIGIQQQNICVIGIDTFGCSDTACLIISTFDNCGNIVLPKAFSPNNDGINDEFKPLAHYPDCFTEILFRIYDRWGNLIFESTDINKGWDGTYKAVAQPNDAYIYTLDAKNYFGRKIIFNGNVTLVR